MRLDPRPVITQGELLRTLSDLITRLNQQVNGITEGRISNYHAAYTAPPTAGTWAQGDRVRNSAPSELGSASSKYVITEWVCVVSGTPGTWVEMRSLTGN